MQKVHHMQHCILIRESPPSQQQERFTLTTFPRRPGTMVPGVVDVVVVFVRSLHLPVDLR
jgi:hypothetical protein